MVSLGMSTSLKLKVALPSAGAEVGARDRRLQQHGEAFRQGNFVATTRV
jgi:hypothetical protein